MGWWSGNVVPRIVDVSLRGADIGERRRETCAGLHGTVLELGFGSGLNVPHYPPTVTEVLGVEPSSVAWALGSERVAASPVPVRRLGLDGASLPLPDHSVDDALSTFTLCTIPDVERALTEVLRVLRPRGELHFVEHGLAPDPEVERWQRRMDAMHARVVGGCHITRPIVDLVEGAGFAVTSARHEYAGWPKSTGYVTIGRATAAT